VRIVDAANPAQMTTVATYCADMPAAGGPRASLGADFIGLTSDLGGYTVLSTSSTLGVPEPVVTRVPLPARPNPTRGSVTFDVPEQALGAVLEIHDVGGRRVRSWIATAAHERWDGRDEHGAAAAPGVYFVRLATPGGGVCNTRIAILR